MPGMLAKSRPERSRSLNDDAKSSDQAIRDVIQELALKLGDRESRAVAEIDQALMRMNEGSYGLCVRCGKAIEERRLESCSPRRVTMPLARPKLKTRRATVPDRRSSDYAVRTPLACFQESTPEACVPSMTNYLTLPIGDGAPSEINAVIEIPRGQTEQVRV